jgi:hypothetical protein
MLADLSRPPAVTCPKAGTYQILPYESQGVLPWKFGPSLALFYVGCDDQLTVEEGGSEEE